MHDKFKGRHKGGDGEHGWRLPPHMLMEQRLPADQQSRVTTMLSITAPGVESLKSLYDKLVADGFMTRTSQEVTRSSGNRFRVFSYDWVPSAIALRREQPTKEKSPKRGKRSGLKGR